MILRGQLQMFHDSHRLSLAANEGQCSTIHTHLWTDEHREPASLAGRDSWNSDPSASGQRMLLGGTRSDDHAARTDKVSADPEQEADIAGAPSHDRIKPVG